jgi:drug/metabolite transporter (DMT)-like permease
MVVLFGLITAFSWAFANVFTQQATRTRTKPAVIMFWVLLVTTAAILPFALAIDHLQGPWTPGRSRPASSPTSGSSSSCAR